MTSVSCAEWRALHVYLNAVCPRSVAWLSAQRNRLEVRGGVFSLCCMDPLLTIHEVATRYGVDRDAVSRWIASRELEAINVNRSRTAKRPTWRISQEALIAFDQARSSKACEKTPARPRPVHRPTVGRKWL
jgi:hypothetical protein